MPSPKEQRKFYLRTPDLEFVRDGPIKIGNIITDMFLPQDRIAFLDPLPKTMQGAGGSEWNIERENHASFNMNLSTKIYEVFGGQAEAKKSRALRTVYDFDEIESWYLEKNPTAKEMKEFRKKDAEVDGALNDGPVYIISGLKIAKGLKYTNERTNESQAGVSGGAHITDDVALEGGMESSRGATASESYKLIGDCIIAYRLHIVKPGGWRWRGEQKLTTGTHDPGQAGFMNREQDAEKPELESEPGSQQDISYFADEQSYGRVEQKEFDSSEEPWALLIGGM